MRASFFLFFRDGELGSDLFGWYCLNPSISVDAKQVLACVCTYVWLVSHAVSL
jgi:hypothetical protein